MFSDPDELAAEFLQDVKDQRGWTFRAAPALDGDDRGAVLVLRRPGGDAPVPADELAGYVRGWLVTRGLIDTDDVVNGVAEAVTTAVARE